MEDHSLDFSAEFLAEDGTICLKDGIKCEDFLRTSSMAWFFSMKGVICFLDLIGNLRILLDKICSFPA